LLRGKDKKENQDRHFSSVLQKWETPQAHYLSSRRKRLQLWRGKGKIAIKDLRIWI